MVVPLGSVGGHVGCGTGFCVVSLLLFFQFFFFFLFFLCFLAFVLPSPPCGGGSIGINHSSHFSWSYFFFFFFSFLQTAEGPFFVPFLIKGAVKAGIAIAKKVAVKKAAGLAAKAKAKAVSLKAKGVAKGKAAKLLGKAKGKLAAKSKAKLASKTAKSKSKLAKAKVKAKAKAKVKTKTAKAKNEAKQQLKDELKDKLKEKIQEKIEDKVNKRMNGGDRRPGANDNDEPTSDSIPKKGKGGKGGKKQPKQQPFSPVRVSDVKSQFYRANPLTSRAPKSGGRGRSSLNFAPSKKGLPLGISAQVRAFNAWNARQRGASSFRARFGNPSKVANTVAKVSRGVPIGPRMVKANSRHVSKAREAKAVKQEQQGELVANRNLFPASLDRLNPGSMPVYMEEKPSHQIRVVPDAPDA